MKQRLRSHNLFFLHISLPSAKSSEKPANFIKLSQQRSCSRAQTIHQWNSPKKYSEKPMPQSQIHPKKINPAVSAFFSFGPFNTFWPKKSKWEKTNWLIYNLINPQAKITKSIFTKKPLKEQMDLCSFFLSFYLHMTKCIVLWR